MPYGRGTIGQFCWHRLMTSDINGAKKFYSKLFGWELHRAHLGDLPIFLFKQGDKEVGGLIETPIGYEDTFGAPHWMSYIAVDDISATVANAVEMGATVLLSIKPISTMGYVAILLDPHGARIGLWQGSSEIY